MSDIVYGLTLREDPLAERSPSLWTGRAWQICLRKAGEKSLFDRLVEVAQDLSLEERPEISLAEDARAFVSSYHGEWSDIFNLLEKTAPMHWGAYLYIFSATHRALLPERVLVYDEDNWRRGEDWRQELDRRTAHDIFNFARAGALFYSRGLITTVPGWYYYCTHLHEDAWLVARQAIKTVDQKLVEMIEESRENAAEGAEW